MNAEELLHPLKENLVVEHDADDPLMLRCLSSAIFYAEGYQKKGPDHYQSHPMTESTKQAVIVLASFFMKAGTVLRPASFPIPRCCQTGLGDSETSASG